MKFIYMFMQKTHLIIRKTRRQACTRNDFSSLQAARCAALILNIEYCAGIIIASVAQRDSGAPLCRSI